MQGSPPHLYVISQGERYAERGREIARQIKALYVPTEESIERLTTEGAPLLLLRVGQDGLALLLYGTQKKPLLIRPSFLSGATRYRLTKGNLRSSLLAKSLTSSSQRSGVVLDGTGGFLIDSLSLATLGVEVHARERHPVVALLAEQALLEAQNDPELQEAASRVHFQQGEGSLLLNLSHLDGATLYLDPMFPGKGEKSAKSRGPLQVLQALVGKEDESKALFLKALSGDYPASLSQVVVKRAKKDPPLAGFEPAYSRKGRSVRFDVYPLV